ARISYTSFLQRGDIRTVSDFNSGFVREIDVLVREARTGV
ncbi:unnamed protein product, partial [Linum tenue]